MLKRENYTSEHMNRTKPIRRIKKEVLGEDFSKQ